MPSPAELSQDDRHTPLTVESPDAAMTKRAEEIVRALDLLGRAGAGRSLEAGSPFTLTGPDGESIPLPAPLYEALRATAEILAAGGSATIVPIEKELTTQEAAELLGMSRQYLVRLLDAGEMPHHRVRSHRRIKLSDLLVFKTDRDAERRNALRELTRITEGAALDEFPGQDNK